MYKIKKIFMLEPIQEQILRSKYNKYVLTTKMEHNFSSTSLSRYNSPQKTLHYYVQLPSQHPGKN